MAPRTAAATAPRAARFFGEAHDLLCRVDVYVYPARVYGDFEGDGRVAAGGDGGPVGVVEAAVEVVGPHEAAVHGDGLVGATALGQAGQGGVAFYLERAGLVFYFPQGAGLGDAHYLGEPFPEVFRAGQREVIAVLFGEAERYLRVGNGEVGEGLRYRRPFGAGAFEERPTGRDIVEQPVYEDGRAFRV